MLDGILVIDKPAGMTSAQVVARVKRLLRAKRVGHTGTLDPMATGVLPLCIGEATKIAGYLLAEDKRYLAELELGATTDTLDADGQILERRPEAAARVTEVAFAKVLAAFLGPQEQVPPMYSALKRDGKRLHELARAGQTVERPPRPIHIYELTLEAFEAPRARFSVHCSKGTYVRSLAADLGERLGCGAHLTALRRTASGAFTLENAVDLAWLEGEGEPGQAKDEERARDRAATRMVDAAQALGHLASVDVPEPFLPRVENGQIFEWRDLVGAGQAAGDDDRPAGDDIVRLLGPGGRLVALATVDERGRVRYRRVFKGIRDPT